MRATCRLHCTGRRAMSRSRCAEHAAPDSRAAHEVCERSYVLARRRMHRRDVGPGPTAHGVPMADSQQRDSAFQPLVSCRGREHHSVTRACDVSAARPGQRYALRRFHHTDMSRGIEHSQSEDLVWRRRARACGELARRMGWRRRSRRRRSTQLQRASAPLSHWCLMLACRPW